MAQKIVKNCEGRKEKANFISEIGLESL